MPTINIQSILYSMFAAISKALGDKYESVKPRVEEMFYDDKQLLTDIAQAFLDKQIDFKELTERLKTDVVKLLESQLLEAGVIVASTAEDTVNGLIADFTGIIQGLLPKTGE